MIKNYFKIAFRNLIKSKVYSAINIGGLAAGMTVAILVGLWIHDELSFSKYHKNYDRIAQVMHHVIFNGEKYSLIYKPYLMGDELRNNYGSDFKHVAMSTLMSPHILTFDEKKFKKTGNYMEPSVPEMLSMQMVKGTWQSLKDPGSILLSVSVANAFFGDIDPIDKVMRLDNKLDVKVTGVYEDFPYNSDFKDLLFVAAWENYLSNEPSVKTHPAPWEYNNFQTYVQLNDQADEAEVSAKIKNILIDKMPPERATIHKPEVFLHPMAKWHLYSEFKNGVNTGGRLEFVWLFGIIGIFVLLLACINFMNLSTARSEKRAKEVGIRKTMGSFRLQLISQFFGESFLITILSFVFSLLLAFLILPSFNEVSDKRMAILWTNPLFWLCGIGFSLFTGLVAGSYPALYLSSFQPIKVLKGTFKAGRFASLPRKILVVLQFTVSVVLIIGTIVVFRQIQFAKDRSIGYVKNGLIMFDTTPEIHTHFTAFRNELLASGEVTEIAESANSTTDYYVSDGMFNWNGKDPDLALEFPINNVTHEYGRTIGWTILEGRDFSKEFPTDSSAFILNETAVKFMGLKDPIGEIVQWRGKFFHVIGVIKDIVFESPYQPVRPSIFQMTGDRSYLITIKLNPDHTTRAALNGVQEIFQRYNPDLPFDYKFVDEEYDKKFKYEERVGKLATFFTFLAVFISCMGIFGLATYMAEQRTKEIGIRKVLGSSVFRLWGLMSRDFVILVVISLLIATPIAYYFLYTWLQNYPYRSGLSWWIFALSGVGSLLITLLTISYQAIKAAIANPVKSLRSE